MIKIIKESFKITNNYIVIATPLILFSLMSGLYMIFSIKGNLISVIISATLFFLMTAAFLSGWFYMVQKAVKEPDLERRDSLIFEFPSGVGEYFLSILGLMFNIIIISAGIMIITLLAGKHFIGSVGISYSTLSSAFANVETMKTLVASLNEEQLMKINAWNILLLSGLVANYFIVLLYPATMYFINKNPFKAFWISLKDTFGRKILKNIALFLLIFTVYFVLSTLTALLSGNIFVHFVLTLVNFYFATFAVILNFNYYYLNFAKIGSEIDTVV